MQNKNKQKVTETCMAEAKQPAISVIVPVYKVEKYLNECIDSILHQTFADFELILVDDGSPDGCPALCDAAAAKDSRVRVIHQSNKGLSGARNTGLDAARGDWIAFVDSDDKVLPEYLEKLYSKAIKEKPDIVICDFMTIHEDGSYFRYQEKLVKDENLSQENLIRKILLTPFVVVWTKLYRRELLSKIRFQVGRLYEDAFFTAELFPYIKKAVCIPEALYCYRRSLNSIMRSRRTARNLKDQVEANYASFCCAMNHGLTDVLCIYYWLMVKYYFENWRLISPEERRSKEAQCARKCRCTAWKQLKQAHAATPQNIAMAAVHRVCPPLYIWLKG